MSLVLPRVALWAVLAMAVVATGCSTGLEDTVFTGRWERGEGTFSRSVVAIWKQAGEYRYRVDRFQDDVHVLRCPREGACTIHDGDAPTYELVFVAKFDQEREVLFVECSGSPLDGKSTPVDWVDRVSVTPDGSELLVQRVELNHEPRTDGPRRFTKISDRPF